MVNTEDVSLITAEYLRNFDAIYFFTSGELPLSDRQKAARATKNGEIVPPRRTPMYHPFPDRPWAVERAV